MVQGYFIGMFVGYVYSSDFLRETIMIPLLSELPLTSDEDTQRFESTLSKVILTNTSFSLVVIKLNTKQFFTDSDIN